jgi:hypothetical protein
MAAMAGMAPMAEHSRIYGVSQLRALLIMEFCNRVLAEADSESKTAAAAD